MSFLNKKEEVIDLVLTVKGREKYSQSKLKPFYYQFYDDEIVYDLKQVQTASAEGQNEIVPRIRDMIVIKNQSCWQGPVNGLNGIFEIEKEPFFYEMGESDPFSQFKPAWSVTAIKGKTTGSVSFIPLEKNITSSLSDYQGEKIPQFNVRCDYGVYVKATDKGEIESIYYDRTSDDFLFSISEANEIDEKENFEIEVFQYVWERAIVDGQAVEKIIDMKQLYFDGKEYSEEYVEYFFDMAFDTEKTLDIHYVEEIQKVEDGFKTIPSECE